jgi:competence ComEA-like helix-hairpin-helix protein
MDLLQQTKWALSISVITFLGSAVPLWGQSEPALPDGPGKGQFQRVCTTCHGLEMMNGTRMSEGGWAGVVDDMISRGAQASSDDVALITKYLAKNFGQDSGAGASQSAKVHVNTASAKELTSGLGLGDKDAAAIVTYREANGNFANLAALRKVPGLDLKKLDESKDRIDFSTASDKGKS